MIAGYTNMRFQLSWIGVLYLIALIGPNIIWTRNKPKDYEDYVVRENPVLRSLERTGETLVTCTALILVGNGVLPLTARSLWLLASVVLMVLYELFWLRYFRSPRTMGDFYSGFLGIPVPGASLPVAAFLLLAIYDRNILLGVSVLILAVGHIGIHLQHYRAFQRGPGDDAEE